MVMKYYIGYNSTLKILYLNLNRESDSEKSVASWRRNEIDHDGLELVVKKIIKLDPKRKRRAMEICTSFNSDDLKTLIMVCEKYLPKAAVLQS